MNSLECFYVFFLAVPHSIWFGQCDEISFSLCWMSKENGLERHNGNLWLNSTSLRSLGTAGKVTSITLSPFVENKLSLHYGGSVLDWTVTIVPRTKFTRITGRQKPEDQPADTTRAWLELLRPTEVFACENGTLFFHQEEDFFLAVGHTLRLPLQLESSGPSTLLLSWREMEPDVLYYHSVTLYDLQRGSYSARRSDTTSLNHHRFTNLDSCGRYLACLERGDTRSFTCLATITDPDVPENFEVTSWNSTSISLAWECPLNLRYSLFLLTTFYLNGTDHISEEVTLWLEDEVFAFTLTDLQPCNRLKFGLQTVCQAGIESRYSRMVLSDGNSVRSNIEALRQSSFGPDNYTLSWEAGNTSSISMFRVYHQGALQGTTLTTSYTVKGLLPCNKYEAKVEALCGQSVVMSTKTIKAHTGPSGVSELRYRANDSTAVWTAIDLALPARAFIYQLSQEGGPPFQSSQVTTTELHLPGLEEGKSYILDVWEDCNSEFEYEPSQLRFEAANSSLGFLGRANENNPKLDITLDFDSIGLTMMVPWTVPEEMQEDMSEPGGEMKELLRIRLQDLMDGFDPPVRVALASVQPAAEPNKTEILFISFDLSISDENVALPSEDQLAYIDSLNSANFTVRDGVIYWDGPDLCASHQSSCPDHSQCVNTLDSYSCVCQLGYYDISSIVESSAASQPVCKEKGLFSQCLSKLMTGGIAKSYLTGHIGGKVEVRLNDGRCAVNESSTLYYFQTSRRPSQCGTERQVNTSHIKYQNTLTVSPTKEQKISRRDLKVVWNCVYPRHYVRNAQVSVDMEWFSSISLVEFNSSLLLGLTMTLYKDQSYTNSYTDTILLGHEDTLFFQVELQTNASFASDVLLQVESCWATESTDPQDSVQGVLLQERCPVDASFQWLSVNGQQQSSRFSLQMFSMPQRLPLYFHCLANICAHEDNCTESCSVQRRSRRSVDGRRAAVVSAGPLIISSVVESAQPDQVEHAAVLSIVAGSIGLLAVTFLSVSATKAILMYCERQQ